MPRNDTEYKSCHFEIKNVGENGKFSGYGSIFGNVDSWGDIVAKGAFKESLATRREKNQNVPILWQHSPSEPIGVYTKLKEDDTGLYVEGQLLMSSQRGREAYELMKMGAISGLSIGFSTRKSEFDEETEVRTLTQVDLWEISIVTFPANEEARVEQVKAKLENGDVPSEREFEGYLRDVGYSKKQARLIIADGYRALSRGRDDHENQEEENTKNKDASGWDAHEAKIKESLEGLLDSLKTLSIGTTKDATGSNSSN